jgi:murein DD-endopeptidase MepM/ murein hydrolase activator NlpD
MDDEFGWMGNKMGYLARGELTEPAESGPFIWPVLGLSVSDPLKNTRDPRLDGWSQFSNGFGNRYPGGGSPEHPYHPGEDWNRADGNDANNQVYAIADGEVVRSHLMSETRGWAVVVRHRLPAEIDVTKYVLSGTEPRVRGTAVISSAYLHLNQTSFGELDVRSGQSPVPLRKGDLVGTIFPSTAGGPHLHFEVRANEDARTAGTPDGYYATRQDITDFGYINPSGFLKDNVQVTGQRWQRAFGGTGDDWGSSVRQTSDGGYIVAGSTYSRGAGGSDVALSKTDASGRVLWTRTFGGLNDDYGSSVEQTSDGGFIVLGDTVYTETGESGDIYLARVDVSGRVIWTNVLRQRHGGSAHSLALTSDGGYAVLGVTGQFGEETAVCLIKTDSAGNDLWTSTLECGDCARQTRDGGYVITGASSPTTAKNPDVLLLKTDSSGKTLWTKRFGGTRCDAGAAVLQTRDGGYIVVGTTSSFGAGEQDVYLVKTDSVGEVSWTRTFGGPRTEDGSSVQLTADGGYIVAGTTSSFGAGEQDVYLVKTDSMGEVSWTRTFGGPRTDHGSSVQQTADGGYVIVGKTFSFGAGEGDVYLIKTDSSGNASAPPERDSQE